MNKLIKNILILILISLIIFFISHNFLFKKKKFKVIDYSTFIEKIKDNEIKEVKINEREIKINCKNNEKYKTYIPINNNKLLKFLLKKKINIKSIPLKKQNIFTSLFISCFPTILIFILWILYLYYFQNSKNIMFFGKSKSKLLNKNEIKTRFKNVAGCDEAKEELIEIVNFLKNPNKFKKMNGKIPKGILMFGPPGTGKTLLAKAVAGESKVPFISISGSSFVEMFIGVGASRVRDLFEKARKISPCIIFIDEIDALGKKRGININSGQDEREQTLNQMLIEMDGLKMNKNIIIIAATNRPDILDNALLRPGRFDRQVILNLPDINGRVEILKVHIKKKPISKDVNISIIARSTPGFSGADLANLVNEATIFAINKNKKNISMKDFEKAKDKIIMGLERRSLAITNFQKELIAYHESGHAIVGKLIIDHDPLHKVTIIPRGKSLGITYFLPKRDIFNYTKRKLESKISVLYGGRIAEEIIYGKINISTGSYNDIKVITKIARNMVTKWGFSKKIGPLIYSINNKFLKNSISNKIHNIIDYEIKKIIDLNYKKAYKILYNNLDILHSMKNALIEKETINSLQVKNIILRKKNNEFK